MKKKNLLLILLAVLFLLAGFGLLYIYKHEKNLQVNISDKHLKDEQTAQKPMPEPKTKSVKNAENKKANLYKESLDKIPMNSIPVLAEANPTVKEQFNKLLENTKGVYFVKRNHKNNETIILSEDYDNNADKYSRHNLVLTTITFDNKLKHKKFGYEGLEGETENIVVQKADFWVYDENTEPPRPLNHTVYDKNKKIVFTETWNYDEENPIKYELKNADGKTISILKETIDNGVNYRKEHIFYDKEGNVEMSISASYEGADLKRLNYYNAASPDDSFIVENTYENGLKTEEKVYDKDLKVIETIKADYNNGELEKLHVNNSEDSEIETIEQEN